MLIYPWSRFMIVSVTEVMNNGNKIIPTPYYGETDEHISNNDIVSPLEGIICHYCDLEKCPCCLYEVNYYYNYGLSRRKITLCTDCYSEIYGNGRNISSEIVTKAFTRICETITNSATFARNLRNRQMSELF